MQRMALSEDIGFAVTAAVLVVERRTQSVAVV
jgi:hypothetical protein